MSLGPLARGWWLVLIGCAAMRAPEAAGHQPPASRQPRAVSISQFRFTPAELTVTVGDSVVWTNEDALPHTTSADSGAWSSPEMPRGGRFSHVAARAGRFSYHCAAHPVMRGTLVVVR